MKMITSIVFEIKLPDEDVKAFKAMSEEDRESRITEMKRDFIGMVDSESVEKTTFTNFTIEFQEGE
jgi:hypothetical protein